MTIISFDRSGEDTLLDIASEIKTEAKEAQYEVPKSKHEERIFVIPPMYSHARYANAYDEPKGHIFEEAIRDSEDCLLRAEDDKLSIEESYDIITPTYLSLKDVLEMSDSEICSYIRNNINIVQ